MTDIKASCARDGEVEITDRDVHLRIHPADDDQTFYSFTCPTCGKLVVKPADEHVIALLMSGGVVPDVLDIPDEALEEHKGDPLTLDDLIDLHDELGALPDAATFDEDVACAVALARS